MLLVGRVSQAHGQKLKLKNKNKTKIQMDKKRQKNMMIKPTKIDNHSIGSHRPIYINTFINTNFNGKLKMKKKSTQKIL